MQNIINFIKTLLIKILTRSEIDYNTWVFSSSFNTKFNYNSKYLFEYVLKNKPSITPIYVINNDKLRVNLQQEYGEKYFIETKSFRGIKRVLNSGVWFTSAGLPCYGFNLNKKRLIINLWHGVPLKRIALLEKELTRVKKIYFKYVFSNNYSYIITTSQSLTQLMKKSFGVPEYKIKVLGQPRNDVIYKEKNNFEEIKKLYSDLPESNKLVLYAPTYRDNSKTVFFPFEDFNIEELNKVLNENKIIIFIRSHQSESGLLKAQQLGDRVKLINDDKVEDIMDIINVFDLLITDYSSMYVDFLLTEKPILFLPYDKNNYIEERGFNFTYNQVTPGPKPNNMKEFIKQLLELLIDNQYYLSERKQTNDFFNEVKCNSSEKIYEFVNTEIKKY